MLEKAFTFWNNICHIQKFFFFLNEAGDYSATL